MMVGLYRQKAITDRFQGTQTFKFKRVTAGVGELRRGEYRLAIESRSPFDASGYFCLPFSGGIPHEPAPCYDFAAGCLAAASTCFSRDGIEPSWVKSSHRNSVSCCANLSR